MSTHISAVGAGADEAQCPLMPTYGPPQVMFVRGDGSTLWDRDGNEYLDALSGLAVTSLGHSHPAVTAAIAEQAGKLLHVSNLYATEHNGDVARTLDGLMGGGGQVFFANSGAEANECAFKLARRWAGHGRYGVITAMRSFHGRTLATLHATGQPEKHEVFQPLPEGFRHVEFEDVDALDAAIDEWTAAVMVEAIQGEGGVNVPPDGYLRDLRALCDERQILLMVDEVQTGLGRTGDWFAHQHDRIVPDVVTMAKALGNGVPIGACWAKREVAAAFRPGDHATTFGGQPLVTAAAKATLRVMKEIDAPRLAREKGAQLSAALSALEGVASVRGRGLLIAAEIDPDLLGDRPASDVVSAALGVGLVIGPSTKTAVRCAPALTIEATDVDRIATLLGEALGALS
ncbi:MAG: acetylornithine/succinylornithine family transaminase [Acidimicrobiales bacterium]